MPRTEWPAIGERVVVSVEQWGARTYMNPREVSAVVCAPASLRYAESPCHSTKTGAYWSLVLVLIEGESEPRLVALSRVKRSVPVEGASDASVGSSSDQCDESRTDEGHSTKGGGGPSYWRKRRW